MLFSLLYKNYRLNAFNGYISYSWGESSYNDTERFPTCSPIFFQERALIGRVCSFVFTFW